MMLKIKSMLSILLLLITTLNIANNILENYSLYTEKFDPQFYRQVWGQSQYVLVNPTQILPDEIVYSFAAWEYMHGVNPAIFNADQPPLGKYFIGLSQLFFNNTRLTGPIFNILCLVVLFFLSNLVFKNYLLSSLIISLFSFEKIFIVQMKYSPLLDNIQLFFILLSFLFFISYLKNLKKNKLLALAFLSLGAVAVTKFWISAFVIYIIWFIYLVSLKNKHLIFTFVKFSPVTLITMLAAYIPSFLQGMTLRGFFGVQKYIFSFHHEKLNIDPTSFWDLMLFNRWHSFSGIRQSVDWQISWPILTILTLYALVNILSNSNIKGQFRLIAIWFLIYVTLLSSSSILPRYIIPVLPAMYILSFFIYPIIFVNLKKIKK